MPIHDWTRVDTGLFHDFHQSWIRRICDVLNVQILPDHYFALIEQRKSNELHDVLALELSPRLDSDDSTVIGKYAKTNPPKTRVVQRTQSTVYNRYCNRITIRDCEGHVAAIVEIVSPGNKASRSEFRSFIEKTTEFIAKGVHVLIIDLFPPGPRDPNGMHHALWSEFTDDLPTMPPDKPLTLASYDAGDERVAYVEPTAVGDVLMDMPLFFQPGRYVEAPLESTYVETWRGFPNALKGLLE